MFPRRDRCPPTLFVGNPLNLQILYLRENNISKLEIDTFKGLTALQELDLQKNELVELQSGLFHDLSSLQILYMSRNNIAKLEVGIFRGLYALKEPAPDN